VTVEELRRYLNNEKSQRQTAEKPEES
jgi:hypothetical protein